jgi:hypothetical protein
MTGPLDLVPRLESWLVEDDGIRLADRVIDGVIAQTAGLPQVGRRGLGSGVSMRRALGVAALLGAVVVGIGLYRSLVLPVGHESPSPSPSASASVVG